MSKLLEVDIPGDRLPAQVVDLAASWPLQGRPGSLVGTSEWDSTNSSPVAVAGFESFSGDRTSFPSVFHRRSGRTCTGDCCYDNQRRTLARPDATAQVCASWMSLPSDAV